MAEEILVKEALTKEMIKSGSELMRYVDKSELDVHVYMWMYLPEVNRWRMVIASPKVQTEGPLKVYGKLQSVLSEMQKKKKSSLTLEDVMVLETDSRLISAMKKAFKKTKNISGLRLTRAGIEGQYVDDIYIYRVN